MIPFASQRGSGQDLATHLLNEHDNEYMELADLRGAVADDLHGAFAEWEAQASAMTKCANYLYSLSVNPDPAQGPMPRDLYDDYIARVEAALGLDGQPCAVVFHIKEDGYGLAREHCHVVWSRIDVQEMKAIHMSFDRDKLMTVTRQFARDHDIELAPGYHKLEDRARQTYRQLSLYEKAQQETTGLSKEERRAIVTELWHGRDTPESFVKALEYHGYVLATGKRPFVLIDIYGHTNSLPKLIDDKAANTKAIREFLGDDHACEKLPSVEEALVLAQEHRETLKAFKQSERRGDKIDELKAHQTERRARLAREIEAFLDRQKQERLARQERHRAERDTHRRDYLEQVRDIRQQRQENKPNGLAAFLAKVSGVELAQRKYHKYQDKKRHDAFLEQKREMRDRQQEEQLIHQRAQEMRALDMERKRRALDHMEERERQSLEKTFEKQQAIRHRRGHEHMPALRLELSPPGRWAVPHKAKNRFTSDVRRKLEPARKVRRQESEAREHTIRDAFERAAQDARNRRGVQGGTAARSFRGQEGLKRVDQQLSPREQPGDPKPSKQAKGIHTDRVMRTIDRKQENSDRPRQEKSTNLELRNPERKAEVDWRAVESLPKQESDCEDLRQTFDAAASANASPESGSEDGSDHAVKWMIGPDRKDQDYGPKPPNSEPDRER